MFHYSLNAGGILQLGTAETTASASGLFAELPGGNRLFRRLPESPGTLPVTFLGQTATPARVSRPPTPLESVAVDPPVNIQALADRLLLQRYAPVAVLTNQEGDILYTSGGTGKYLEPAAGKANWNIHVMARDSVRRELDQAFQAALLQGRPVTARGKPVRGGRPVRGVAVTVEPVHDVDALRDTLLVVFAEAAAGSAAPPDGKAKQGPRGSPQVKLQLLEARRELQAMREEMQGSQEELRSANEELQATNEELQSTNEELTTSQEEMQSLNEELQTVNQELQAKVDELSRTSNDMKNLLDSTEIATLFLDEGLRIRRFTPRMAKIIKLIPGDVNRPVTDLASDLVYPELAEDAREVLRTLVFRERQVPTAGGGWYTTRVMPYRTSDNRIDGLVITFLDITSAKQLEGQLRGVRDGPETTS
jgi:two-component system CheB/CheR fusion protein